MRVIHVHNKIEVSRACRGKRYVYIGPNREGAPRNLFGNPYKIGVDGDRAWIIVKYEIYLRGSPDLLEIIRRWPGDKVLGCWCKPEECHGDVIVKIWEEMHAELGNEEHTGDSNGVGI
jgi:hypothetical protein